MKIHPSFVDARKLVTIEVPGKVPTIPRDAIVRVRPSADATEAEIEKAVAKAQKTAATVRVLAKPRGSVVGHEVVAEVEVRTMREICMDLARATPEEMREAVVAEVENRLKGVGL
jgi:uncharacterized protein YijF (DUF1287 family)